LLPLSIERIPSFLGKNDKKISLACVLLIGVSLYAEVVEVISSFYTEENLAEGCFEKIRNAYSLRFVDLQHPVPITKDHRSIKRYVVFSSYEPIADLRVLPLEKTVLFMMEPAQYSYEDAEPYCRVYTWDDAAIDNVKFFKYCFPDLLPMIDVLAPFEEKKLCTMVVRNWSIPHRGAILAFFLTKPKGELEFYGSPYLYELSCNKFYKGRIPGKNCGKEKIDILKNYRFCICFENNTTLNGYISEKIFPCFAAGCVPVYFGAPNVEEYIPKNCFIDYRDFNNNEELYQFMKSMSKEVYERYIENIRAFLVSEKAQRFSPQSFAQILYEAVNQ
jgi:hypothetical protein